MEERNPGEVKGAPANHAGSWFASGPYYFKVPVVREILEERFLTSMITSNTVASRPFISVLSHHKPSFSTTLGRAQLKVPAHKEGRKGDEAVLCKSHGWG